MYRFEGRYRKDRHQTTWEGSCRRGLEKKEPAALDGLAGILGK